MPILGFTVCLFNCKSKASVEYIVICLAVYTAI